MKRFILIVFLTALLSCDNTKSTETSNSDSVNRTNTQLPNGDPIYLKTLDSLLNQIDTVGALALIKKEKVDINMSYPDGYGTLLYHFVCETEDKKYSKPNINPHTVRFLILTGADPNAIGLRWGDYGSLHNFIVTCDPVISDVLIRAGSKHQKRLIIPCAALRGDKEAIVRAIENGANPTDALEYAFLNDREFFESLLLNPKTDKSSALYFAYSTGVNFGRPVGDIINLPPELREVRQIQPDSSLIRKLVLMGANPDHVVHYYVSKKSYDMIQFLINQGADRNLVLGSAIMSSEHDINFIKKMILIGARLKSPPMEYFSNDKELQNLILPIVDGKGYSIVWEMAGQFESILSSPLLDACYQSKIEDVEFMLTTGADPNAYADPSQAFEDLQQKCNKISALWLAMYNKNYELVALLRKHKAKLPQDCKPPSWWAEPEQYDPNDR